jgi:hypothetical protein
MRLDASAIAVLEHLRKANGWERLVSLDRDPDLPEDAIAFVPGLVDLGLVVHSHPDRVVHISIPGIVLLKLLALGRLSAPSRDPARESFNSYDGS